MIDKFSWQGFQQGEGPINHRANFPFKIQWQHEQRQVLYKNVKSLAPSGNRWIKKYSLLVNGHCAFLEARELNVFPQTFSTLCQ